MPKWKPDDERALVEQWPRRSAGQIAATLNKSRSAVSGMANRMQKSGVLPKGKSTKHFDVEPSRARINPPPPKPKPMPKQPPTPSVTVIVVSPSLVGIAANQPPAPCTILELDGSTCRWPLWSVDTPPEQKLYCGSTVLAGLPYCRHHCKMAFTPVRTLQHAEY